MLRRLLDALYGGSAALAGLFMVGLLLMVLSSIAGRQLGFYLPGSDAYAGYLMAAAAFLAMAHTLKRGEHIRVTLLLNLLQGRSRRGLELFALGLACLLAGVSAWYSVRLSWQSWQFNDISTLNDATPLWLPQLSMAFGNVVLAIAFVDEWQLEWRGLRQHPTSDEALHLE